MLSQKISKLPLNDKCGLERWLSWKRLDIVRKCPSFKEHDLLVIMRIVLGYIYTALITDGMLYTVMGIQL